MLSVAVTIGQLKAATTDSDTKANIFMNDARQLLTLAASQSAC
jgi:hypothetical protein